VEMVRVDFALIPGEPMFGDVITASQAITDEFCYNENVIDAKCFPPHLSLHICTLPRAALGQVTAELKVLAAADLPDITPVTVERASGGYVMLSIERTSVLMDLHEAVLDVAARARDGLDGDPYGSPWIRSSFTPHISLAKIDRDDQAGATAIGLRTLGECLTARSRALDLCDIGEHSERWGILASFPAAEQMPIGDPGTYMG
jgi:hypothetical protein